MPRVLGYGGLANTAEARDFSTKVEPAPDVSRSRIRFFSAMVFMSAVLLLGGWT